jgi:hypothetical protein
MKAIQVIAKIPRLKMTVKSVPVSAGTRQLKRGWTVQAEQSEHEPLDDEIVEKYVNHLTTEVEIASFEEIERYYRERDEHHTLRLERKLKEIMAETLRG